MTTNHVVLAGLPFVIEPVSTERVQSWASFAAQSSTQGAFNVVGNAFGAFWMEKDAADAYQQAAQYLYDGELQFAVRWLDGAISGLRYAAGRWQRVIEDMTRDAQLQTWASSWYADASLRLEALSVLLALVIEWVARCCAQEQWALPENAQEYLASRQSGGR